MDFKSLRDQILTNIDNYNTQEIKIVLTKLLKFLIEINEKNTKLEKENQFIKNEVKTKKVNVGEYSTKVDELINKTNLEANKITENAKQIATKTINEAETKKKEIIDSGLQRIEDSILDIKRYDEEVKSYRNHVLMIFKNNLYKFADSDFYIVKSSDKDLKELLKFFEVDEQLQIVCDETISKLQLNKEYKRIIDKVDKEDNNIKENKHIQVLNDIIKKENNINEKEMNCIDRIHKVIKSETLDETNEDVNVDKLSKQKFIEIINKYNNKG